MKKYAWLLFVATTLGLVNQAQGVASFTGSAQLTASLSEVENLTTGQIITSGSIPDLTLSIISTTTDVGFPSSDVTSTASATPSGVTPNNPQPFGFGDVLELNSAASGQAVTPAISWSDGGASFANAFPSAMALIHALNSSTTDAYEVRFSVAYEASADADADHPNLDPFGPGNPEIASVAAGITISAITFDDPLPQVQNTFGVGSPADINAFGGIHSGTFSGGVPVQDNDTITFSIQVDAAPSIDESSLVQTAFRTSVSAGALSRFFEGSPPPGDNAIPEPATAMTGLLGMSALALYRARRRRAA